MIPPSVPAMLSEQTATAPLADFLVAMREDDNWWWRIECGHHLNLFEASVEAQTEAYRQGVRAARKVFEQMWQDEDWDGQCSMGFASTFDQGTEALLHGEDD